METKQAENVSRGQFLRSLGLSSSALMAFYCMGTLTSCSSDDPNPMNTGGNNNGGTGGNMSAGVTGTTTGSGINFTVDLTSENYRKLKTEGEFSIIGDTIVVAAPNNRFVALSKACTHQGTTVQYRKASNDIWCNNHGSEFNLDGTVKKSPAASPLTVYQATLTQDGNTLTVKA
jgi:cytochrome b6-f complex iron-sulfur subunit